MIFVLTYLEVINLTATEAYVFRVLVRKKSYARMIDKKVKHLLLYLLLKINSFISKDFTFNDTNIIYVRKLRSVRS